MLMASGSTKISFLYFSLTTSPTTLHLPQFALPQLTSPLPLHLILIPALFRSHAHVQKGGFVYGLLTLNWVTVVVHRKWCGWSLCVCGVVAEAASCHLYCFSSALCCWLLNIHSPMGDQWWLALNMPQSFHFPGTQFYILLLQLLCDWLLNPSS